MTDWFFSILGSAHIHVEEKVFLFFSVLIWVYFTNVNDAHFCSAMVFRHWVELEDGTVALNPAPTADDDTLATSTFYSQVMLH